MTTSGSSPIPTGVPTLIVRIADRTAVALVHRAGLDSGLAGAGCPAGSVPSCGVTHRVSGALTWQYRDDDRVAEAEDGFSGTLSGACPVCGAEARTDVRVSRIRSRADDTIELTWE